MKKMLQKAVLPLALGGMTMGGCGVATAGPDPFIGEISYVGFNFAPRGWATCDGQLITISSNSALFALLGTTFGGDGRTTFALPDMRGRVPVHVGSGPGLSTYRWGERGGYEMTRLTTAQMPRHSHNTTASTQVAAQVMDPGSVSSQLKATSGTPGTRPAGNYLTKGASVYSSGAPSVDMAADAIATTVVPATYSFAAGTTVSVADNGANDWVPMMQPYLGVYCTIALLGTYPSRQ